MVRQESPGEGSMRIGVPKEVEAGETRVALVPDSVTQAKVVSGTTDDEY